MKRILWVLAVTATLAACGERPQTLGTNKDATSFSGTGRAFTDTGWVQGDKASWESHLKARGQYGQNDYSRMN